MAWDCPTKKMKGCSAEITKVKEEDKKEGAQVSCFNTTFSLIL